MAVDDPALNQALATVRIVAEGLVYAARQCGDRRGEDAILYLWDELRAFVKADYQTRMPAAIR
jgi:hypothetical protein